MKYLQYGLTGFFVLLGAIWYVPAMIWGYEASQYTQASVNGDLTPEQDGAALERVMEGPAPLAWWRTRSDLRAHFRLDAFTAEPVYLRARDICAQVRSILGNCVIESVRFDDRFLRMTERSAGARNQDASISFAIFVDRTVYDRNDLDPIVENIAEVLAAETG